MEEETKLAEAPVEAPIEQTEKPEQTEAPDNTEPNEPEQEGAEAPVKTEEGADAKEEPDSEDEPKKKVAGSQREKRKRLLAEAEVERLRNENEEYKRRLVGDPEGKPGVDRAPTEADFPDDYFSFEQAKVSWNTRQAIREEKARDTERDLGRARRDLQTERFDAYEEYADAVRERIPDFDKVVRSAANVEVKPELADEILASDKSALLQYHLAKNPDKVLELNGLSGRELAKALGRLEASVHLPNSKKATGALPPPTTPKGGAAPAFDPFKSDDMDAYVEWRKKQGAPFR